MCPKKCSIMIFFIPKISFVYGTTIPETLKTVKGNFGIFQECRGEERKV